MIAYVTSIGEATTELCVWSLERQGIEVNLLDGEGSLWKKLDFTYEQADDDFFRVDADVICNQNLSKLEIPKNVWWIQPMTYDWFKQDITYGGIQYIRREALPHLRKRINEARNEDRPETYMSRITEFNNPRRFSSVAMVCGLNNFRNNIDRVKAIKQRRGQYDMYDWELAEKVGKL